MTPLLWRSHRRLPLPEAQVGANGYQRVPLDGHRSVVRTCLRTNKSACVQFTHAAQPQPPTTTSTHPPSTMNLILLRSSELTTTTASSAGDTADEDDSQASPTTTCLLPASDHRTLHIVEHLRKQTGDAVEVGVGLLFIRELSARAYRGIRHKGVKQYKSFAFVVILLVSMGFVAEAV